MDLLLTPQPGPCPPESLFMTDPLPDEYLFTLNPSDLDQPMDIGCPLQQATLADDPYEFPGNDEFSSVVSGGISPYQSHHAQRHEQQQQLQQQQQEENACQQQQQQQQPEQDQHQPQELLEQQQQQQQHEDDQDEKEAEGEEKGDDQQEYNPDSLMTLMDDFHALKRRYYRQCKRIEKLCAFKNMHYEYKKLNKVLHQRKDILIQNLTKSVRDLTNIKL